MVNGHLSSGRCKPSARAVLIALGAGEVPERRANLPIHQMTIDRFFFVESHFRLHPVNREFLQWSPEDTTLYCLLRIWFRLLLMKKYVGIILGIAFVHRLVFLGTRQLWTDELMQARISLGGSASGILQRLREGMDLASPLDFFVQRGMAILLGNSAWALRLHAVLFGTLSVWIFFRIARFLFGEKVALYASVLFAFFPLAYHYSQEGRPYALLLFLTLLSYDLLLRQVYGGDRRWQGWLAIAAVLVLMLYTSPLAVLVILSQGCGLVLSTLWKPAVGEDAAGGESGSAPVDFDSAKWSQILLYVLAAAAAFVLFFPWMRYIWARPGIAPASEILNAKLILRIIKELGDNSYPMAGLLLIAMLTGIRALLRHRRSRTLWWLLTWFLVPIPALLVLEIWAGYFFAVRHILHATPPILLIAGYGVSYVGERLTILPHLPYQMSSPAIAYAGLMIISSVYIGQAHSRSEPADWLGTANFLRQTVRAGDAVSAPGVYALLEYYYPGLEGSRVDDLDAGAGMLASEAVTRRIVVCYDKLYPDPCGGFRGAAQKDPAWGKREFKSFSVFLRAK